MSGQILPHPDKACQAAVRKVSPHSAVCMDIDQTGEDPGPSKVLSLPVYLTADNFYEAALLNLKAAPNITLRRKNQRIIE